MTTDTLISAETSPEVSTTQDATTPASTTPATEQPGTQATASADTASQEASKDAAAETPAAVEYESFVMPEGVQADEALLGEFKAIAKELNLSQKDAQRIVDLQAKAQVAQMEAMQTTRTQWAEATKTDKELGGDHFVENLSVAKKAVEAFATPVLRKLLDDSGLGNHPEVVRLFHRVGKAISEDGRVVQGTKSVAPADPAKRLFPGMT